MYTDENVLEIQRILQTKNPHDILQVEKYTTVEKILKAFKKLSLRLHPDKNKAPGAKEAFQALKAAKDQLLK